MRTKVLRGWAPVHACDLAWGPSKRRDRLGNRQNAFMANGKVALMLTYDPVRASATVLLFGVCLGIEARLLDLRTASSLTSSSFASAVHFVVHSVVHANICKPCFIGLVYLQLTASPLHLLLHPFFSELPGGTVVKNATSPIMS